MKTEVNRELVMNSIEFTHSAHAVRVESGIAGLSKGQDVVIWGEGINGISRWVMLNDGHGSYSVIDFIKSIPLDKMTELICGTDPVRDLARFIDDSGCLKGPGDSSGATAVILRLYEDHMECISVGDSQYMVFVDNKLQHVSVEHTGFNEAERLRLSELKRGVSFVTSGNIKVISETNMKQVWSWYATWPNNTMLACTQALGHSSKTGYAPDVQNFPLVPGSNFRFIMGSDGLFDMLVQTDTFQEIEFLTAKSCKEICELAIGRWKQKWSVLDFSGNIQEVEFDSNGQDDVSVVVWDFAAT